MKLGWIGTGVMGASMAGHLQQGGHELWVYNRTKQKAEALLNNGAQWCDTPAAVAENAQIVFTIVGHPQDVESVYFGADGLISDRAGMDIVVDMTTSQPSLAKSSPNAPSPWASTVWMPRYLAGMWGPGKGPWPSWWVASKPYLPRYCPFLNSWGPPFPTWAVREWANIPRSAIRSWWPGI